MCVYFSWIYTQELDKCMVILYFVILGAARPFHTVVVAFFIVSSSGRVFSFLCSLHNYYCHFYILGIFIGVKWHFVMLLCFPNN